MSQTKVHIHLSVSDLERSKDFYRKFFGVSPVKEKPGYAKFLPDLGPVNLALSQSGGGRPAGAIHHLGIQVDTSAIVSTELRRIKSAGLPVREQMNVECCHANQDKFWVEDPDGTRWEVYHLNYDINVNEDKNEPAMDDAAAAGAGGEAALPVAQVAGCCAPGKC